MEIPTFYIEDGKLFKSTDSMFCSFPCKRMARLYPGVFGFKKVKRYVVKNPN
jgi:hypothetical protein